MKFHCTFQMCDYFSSFTLASRKRGEMSHLDRYFLRPERYDSMSQTLNSQNMKQSLIRSTIILLLSAACNHGQDAVIPAKSISTDQNLLGIVLQVASQSNPSNLILLQDGRAISPQSGFNPPSLQVGNKFLLSFEEQSSDGSEIVKVKVTSFAKTTADFNLSQASSSSSSQSVPNATYAGEVYKVNVLDSIETKKVFATTISFNGSSYNCTGAGSDYPQQGLGSVTIGSSTAISYPGSTIPSYSGQITFKDQNTSSDLVINGSFTYLIFMNQVLYMWTQRGDVFYSFRMLRKG